MLISNWTVVSIFCISPAMFVCSRNSRTSLATTRKSPFFVSSTWAEEIVDGFAREFHPADEFLQVVRCLSRLLDANLDCSFEKLRDHAIEAASPRVLLAHKALAHRVTTVGDEIGQRQGPDVFGFSDAGGAEL